MAAPLRRVQWTKQPKQSRGRGLSFVRALRRPKQKQGTATRSSAPGFASGHCPAPQKPAKRKRKYLPSFYSMLAGPKPNGSSSPSVRSMKSSGVLAMMTFKDGPQNSYSACRQISRSLLY